MKLVEPLPAKVSVQIDTDTIPVIGEDGSIKTYSTITVRNESPEKPIYVALICTDGEIFFKRSWTIKDGEHYITLSPFLVMEVRDEVQIPAFATSRGEHRFVLQAYTPIRQGIRKVTPVPVFAREYTLRATMDIPICIAGREATLDELEKNYCPYFPRYVETEISLTKRVRR